MSRKKRRVFSVKEELLIKSREAMLASVQIFNNPNIQFKSEIFIVISNIAWMYLLHAYYRHNGKEYRYFKKSGKRRKFDRTKNGAFKYWELEKCLNYQDCPLDEVTVTNLKFLIGLRHEIEHQMTTKIDEYLSARFQSNCLNYNKYIKKLFGIKYGIDKHLSVSLQFSSINEDQVEELKNFDELPGNIASYINAYDKALPDELFNDTRFAYRILFVPKSVNKKNQADKVVEFLPANSPEARGLNKEYVLIKDKEITKYLPSGIVKIMRDLGYDKFNMHHHTQLWKSLEAKSPGRGYGVQVENTWYWYGSWVKIVEKHCLDNKEKYSS